MGAHERRGSTVMLVWGPAEPCCWGAWPSSEGFLSPLLVASFLFLRCSSSCLFLFSPIQLQSNAATTQCLVVMQEDCSYRLVLRC